MTFFVVLLSLLLRRAAASCSSASLATAAAAATGRVSCVPPCCRRAPISRAHVVHNLLPASFCGLPDCCCRCFPFRPRRRCALHLRRWRRLALEVPVRRDVRQRGKIVEIIIHVCAAYTPNAPQTMSSQATPTPVGMASVGDSASGAPCALNRPSTLSPRPNCFSRYCRRRNTLSVQRLHASCAALAVAST